MSVASLNQRQRARRNGRSRTRPGRRRPTSPLRHARADLLALTGLGAVALAILVYLALLPPTSFDYRFNQASPLALVRPQAEIYRSEVLAFTIDRQPQVRLRGFYGLERNAEYAFRWSEPTAALTVPINVPTAYRLTLTVLGQTTPGPARDLTVQINDAPPQTVQLTAALRDYTFDYRAERGAFGAGDQPTLMVALVTDPLLPPGDKRELGALVAGIALAPLQPPTPWQPWLLFPNLALLVSSYSVARATGMRVAVATGLAVALLVAITLLALRAGAAAVLLAYQPATHPDWFVGLLLLHGVALLVARVLFGPRVPIPPSAAPTITPRARLAHLATNLQSWPRSWPQSWPTTIRHGWREALAGGLGLAVGLFVTTRAALSLAAFAANRALLTAKPCTWRGEEPLAPDGIAAPLLGVWQRADACWYEKVAAVGYRPGDPAVAFFPLYPLLMRLASQPFADTSMALGARLTLSGLIVSGIAYIVALTGVYRLVRRDFDIGVARRTVLILALFPSAFFFFAPFTEALFLALVVWTLAFARRSLWWAAGVTALLASLTKTQGFLLALPLAWEIYFQWRGTPPEQRRNPGPAILTPLLPLYGLLAFLLYSRTFTGWTSFQAQSSQWGQTETTPWSVLAHSWRYILREGDGVEALTLGLFIFVVALLIGGLRRLPPAYLLYAVPQLLPILTRQTYVTPLTSTSRYLLVFFPAFVVLALLGRRRWLWYPWLILSVLLLAWLFAKFLQKDFVA